MFLFDLAILACLQLGTAGLSNPSCYEVEEKVAEADRNTVIPFPPSLAGKWVSEKCETRTGPEYLLRSYKYSENDTFSAVLHRYRDLSCSDPWYSVLSKGKAVLRGKSWLAQDTVQADFGIESALLVPHSQAAADELSTLLNTTCAGVMKRRLRAHSQFTVYTSQDTADLEEKEGTDWTVGSLTCLKPLRLGHEEAGILRIQVRPPGPLDTSLSRTELLLAETKPKGISFGTPLLFIVKAVGCEVCSALDHSSVLNPPRLSPSTPGNLQLTGEWVSTRCEVRPMGLYLRRRLRVSGISWQVDYNFFSDLTCSGATLTASAEGSLTEGSRKRIPGAVDYDFRVLRAFLTLHDEELVTSLNSEADCGPPGVWQLGVRRDVTPSAGCPPLGITVPTTEYELVRLELDSSGQALLYLGQSEQRKGEKKQRPTSFQPPLLQCNAPELPPLTHFLNSINGASKAGVVLHILPLMVICLSTSSYCYGSIGL